MPTQNPEPASTAIRLFYIQHSDNHNTYVYNANIKGENIDSSKPMMNIEYFTLKVAQKNL